MVGAELQCCCRLLVVAMVVGFLVKLRRYMVLNSATFMYALPTKKCALIYRSPSKTILAGDRHT